MHSVVQAYSYTHKIQSNSTKINLWGNASSTGKARVMRPYTLRNKPSLRSPASIVPLTAHRKHVTTTTPIVTSTSTFPSLSLSPVPRSRRRAKVSPVELARDSKVPSVNETQRPPPTQWTERQALTVFLMGMNTRSKLIAHAIGELRSRPLTHFLVPQRSIANQFAVSIFFRDLVVKFRPLRWTCQLGDNKYETSLG